MMKNKKINVQGIDIVISQIVNQDYICITDIAKTKDGESRAADIIKNWIRNRGTLEYLGTWEQLYNPIFKVVEFDHFKMNSGLASFVLSPGQWIEKTDAIGLLLKKVSMEERSPIKTLLLSFVRLSILYSKFT